MTVIVLPHVAPHAVDLHLPEEAVVITLLARMTDETETESVTGTMTAGTVIALAAPMTGSSIQSHYPISMLIYGYCSDRDTKDDRDREESARENGTNGEDRKGELTLPLHPRN